MPLPTCCDKIAKSRRKYDMKTEAIMTYFSLFCKVSKAEVEKPVKALYYLCVAHIGATMS